MNKPWGVVIVKGQFIASPTVTGNPLRPIGRQRNGRSSVRVSCSSTNETYVDRFIAHVAVCSWFCKEPECVALESLFLDPFVLTYPPGHPSEGSTMCPSDEIIILTWTCNILSKLLVRNYHTKFCLGAAFCRLFMLDRHVNIKFPCDVPLLVEGSGGLVSNSLFGFIRDPEDFSSKGIALEMTFSYADQFRSAGVVITANSFFNYFMSSLQAPRPSLQTITKTKKKKVKKTSTHVHTNAPQENYPTSSRHAAETNPLLTALGTRPLFRSTDPGHDSSYFVKAKKVPAATVMKTTTAAAAAVMKKTTAATAVMPLRATTVLDVSDDSVADLKARQLLVSEWFRNPHAPPLILSDIVCFDYPPM